jgi:nitrogen regulatory protein PII
MKLVRCALNSDNWQAVVDSLQRVTVGITVWDAHDVSPAVSRTASYRGLKYQVPKAEVLIEIVTDDSWLDDILKTVAGDCCVQIFPVEESHRIRDGFMEI